MKIPYDQLKPTTLNRLIEEFVSRDGTDYGEQESSLADKSQQVYQQLVNGNATILFSENTGQCNIIPTELL